MPGLDRGRFARSVVRIRADFFRHPPLLVFNLRATFLFPAQLLKTADSRR
jgi:hypothetical protein